MTAKTPASDRNILLTMVAAALLLCSALGLFVWKVVPTLAAGHQDRPAVAGQVISPS